LKADSALPDAAFGRFGAPYPISAAMVPQQARGFIGLDADA
jgi:hypothetical protein